MRFRNCKSIEDKSLLNTVQSSIRTSSVSLKIFFKNSNFEKKIKFLKTKFPERHKYSSTVQRCAVTSITNP